MVTIPEAMYEKTVAYIKRLESACASTGVIEQRLQEDPEHCTRPGRPTDDAMALAAFRMAGRECLEALDTVALPEDG